MQSPAHDGNCAASTSAGRISGGEARRRSALLTRAAAIGPLMWACRSASEAKASTIQNVVGSVRSAYHTTVPASSSASCTASPRKLATSSAASRLSASLTPNDSVRGGGGDGGMNGSPLLGKPPGAV